MNAVKIRLFVALGEIGRWNARQKYEKPASITKILDLFLPHYGKIYFLEGGLGYD